MLFRLNCGKLFRLQNGESVVGAAGVVVIILFVGEDAFKVADARVRAVEQVVEFVDVEVNAYRGRKCS